MNITPYLRNRIKGTLMGHAIGDALGFAAEGLSKQEVESEFEGGLRDFGQDRARGLRALRKAGMWTDDTNQMLCILESLVEKRRIDRKDIARKFYRWLVDDGFGCGQLMYNVVGSLDYLIDPEGTARSQWIMSGKRSAPNGAVMRTSVLGVWDYADLDAVTENAVSVCQLTHADPRCAASCVAVCIAIACLLQGQMDLAQVIATSRERAATIDPECSEHILMGVRGDLAQLDLDCGLSRGEENRVGYTYVALSAGFWALANAESFEHGVVAIINEGGDADTNASVAGPLLGARFGLEGIPERWMEGIADSRYLLSECDDLIKAMQG